MVKFYELQENTDKNLYLKLLNITASLSNIFSDSKTPFLYYRAMENIFCKSFKADNLSRGDISVDARKDDLGIGLKTFLHNNGKTFQKIAEFNKESYLFYGLSNIDLVIKVSKMRNARIDITKNICNIDKVIYHILTRDKGVLLIYEEKMDYIDIDNITIESIKNNTIHFKDSKNEYSFNKSKSTLFKKFYTDKSSRIESINVEILKDPYEFLLSKSNKNSNNVFIEKNNEIVDYIVLPLYSIRSGLVEEKSGLNQWNAKGRVRNCDEVYIPIPSWIHKHKKGFFNYNTKDFKTESFEVLLPNQKIINMKVAQAGGKALMSNPNKELGYWILREVLCLKKRELVTKKQLDIIGIDSVKLSKLNNGKYALDFLKIGSYDKFEEKYNC